MYCFSIFGVFSTLFNQIDFNAAYAQDVAPRSTQVILQELQSTLQELRDLNTEQNNIIEDKLTTITELKEKNTQVTDKLKTILEEEAKANQLIVEQNTKLEMQKKWLIILSSILLGFVALHFVILALKLKFGISLPYWLNTLL